MSNKYIIFSNILLLLALYTWPLNVFAQNKDSLKNPEFLWKKTCIAIENNDSISFYKYLAYSEKCNLSALPQEQVYIRLISANALFFKGQENMAMEQFQKNIAQLQHNKKWIELENVYFLIANIFENKGEIDSAIRYLEKAQQIAERNPGKIHNNYCSIGFLMQQKGLYPQAEAYFIKCVEYRLRYGLRKKVFKAYGNLQYLYQINGEFEKEFEIINKKIEYSIEIQDSFELADALFSKALFYSFLKDTAAISMYNCALSMAESSHNIKIKSNILNGLGDIYMEKNICEKAIYFYNQSLEIAKENQLYRLAVYNEIDLALCQIKIGDYAKSELHIAKAIKINTQNKYEQQKTHIYLTYSQLLNLTSEYQHAIETADIALRNLKTFKQWHLFPELTKEMINSHINLGNTENAKQLLLKLDSFIALNPSDNYRLIWTDATYLVAKASYNYKQALRMLELKQEIQSKIYTSEYNFNTAKISAIYQLEKQENEKKMLILDRQNIERKIKMQYLFLILLSIAGFALVIAVVFLFRSHEKLKFHTRTIEEKNKKITNLNEAQTLVLRIIGHDLRGPMGNFSQYIGLLIKFFKEKRFEDLIKGLSAIQNQSNAIYLTLSNLLYWAAGQNKNIDFKPKETQIFTIVQQIVNFLQGLITSKKINIEINIEKNQTAYFDENMIELVIRNLVSNAIKFSNQSQTIQINAKPEKGFLLVEVVDDGVGIDAKRLENLNQLMKIESTYGTNSEKGTGLGLKICMEFLEKHQSKLSIKSTPEIGSTFSFLLPLVVPENLS